MVKTKIDSENRAVIPTVASINRYALLAVACLTLDACSGNVGDYSPDASIAGGFLHAAPAVNGNDDTANVVESDLVRMTPKFAYPSRIRNAALSKRHARLAQPAEATVIANNL